MSNRHRQAGSAHLVIIIILVAALLCALGFVFWQNFVSQKDDTSVTSSQTTSATTATTAATAESANTLTDYRKSGEDATGISIASATDVTLLTNAPTGFKDFLRATVGTKSAGCDAPISFTIDQVDSNFAVGTAGSCGTIYALWGNINGDGWKQLEFLQQGGFKCIYVDTYKLNPSMTHNTCLETNGSGRKI